jgi:hypothetical protein
VFIRGGIDMLSRIDGKLALNSLDMEILVGDLFYKCNTKEEVEWFQEQLTSCIECLAEERLEEL